MTLTMKVHPDDPPRKPQPFASLPSFIVDDPTIHPTSKAILLVLASHAWGGKDTAWPSTATIAAKVGVCSGHLRRRLAELERRGLIRREPDPSNRTGRLFRLLWRSPPPAPALAPPQAPARTEADESQGKKKERPGRDGQGMPTLSGDQTSEFASPEDLALFEEWCRSPDVNLARLGRAALATAGVQPDTIAPDDGVGSTDVIEPQPPGGLVQGDAITLDDVVTHVEPVVTHVEPVVVDAPDPVVTQVEPETSPEISPTSVATPPPASPTSCPPRPARIAKTQRSRPPSARRQDPRHVLELGVAKHGPSPALGVWMTRSP
jgi:hypothetical protein